MHSSSIGSGGHQSRNDGIRCAVLCAEDDGVSDRRPTFAARPLATGRYRRHDMNAELTFARAGFAGKAGMFPVSRARGGRATTKKFFPGR
jgi:hypothetical protein